MNTQLYQLIERYKQGTWRAPIFRDIILEEIKNYKIHNEKVCVLDIGCGKGFDDNRDLQLSLAEAADSYIGIEPDTEIILDDHFTKIFRSSFEDAAIEQNSIDIGFAVMVLEHIRDPQRFCDQLHTVLKDGGIFWAFTVDARHPFVFFSSWMEKFGIKDWYLNRLRGTKGEERYENYGVFYRFNTPVAVSSYMNDFSSVEFPPFTRKEDFSYYMPKGLQWLGKSYSYMASAMNLPNSTLFIRVTK